jgi:hypothetical protein
MIRGLVLLSESDVHEPVYLHNPVVVALPEMAELIVELTESRSEVVFRSAFPWTIRRGVNPTHHARQAAARL